MPQTHINHPFLGPLLVEYQHFKGEDPSIDSPGEDEYVEFGRITESHGPRDYYEAISHLTKFDLDWLQIQVLTEIKSRTTEPEEI